VTVTTKPQGPKKLTGIVRSRLPEIEEKLRTGWTLEAARASLEAELGMPVKFNTFRWAVYQARKAEPEKWIAQSKNSSAVSDKQPPVPSPLDPSAMQPARETEPPANTSTKEATAHRSAPRYEPTDDAEEKKRRLAEASRAPLPDVSKWLDKPRKR